MDFSQSIEVAFKSHELSCIQINGNSIAYPEEEPLVWKVRNRKTYPRLPRIVLGEGLRVDVELSSGLSDRRSVRYFQEALLPISHLETILRMALRERQEITSGIRPYPSAGARYPVEIYVATTGIADLGNGLYHYDAVEHCLTDLLQCDPLRELSRITGVDLGAPSLVFFLTGVFHRTCVKYGGRGYRYILIEAGAIAQTICQVGWALGLGSLLLGGFDDSAVAEFLDISWELELEAPLLLITVGQLGPKELKLR